jgi:ssDNA-binding Zn-finger/Zn-ribbon topoisomerase 1
MKSPVFENNMETSIECPECQHGVHLIVKTNKINNNQFLGCPNWPECDFTRGIPHEWVLRAQGQPELFKDQP